MGNMKNAADRPADEEANAEPANETEQTEDDAPRMTRGGTSLRYPRTSSARSHSSLAQN
jgi:hypothetical protein